MGSKPTNFTFPNWSSTANYKAFDVIDGITTGHEAYYYATQDNTNQNPLNNWSLNISSWSRLDGVVRLATATSITPPLARGSYVAITGAGYLNYTGILTNGGSNYLEYPNSGPDDSGSGSGTVTSNLNPAWTTGFGFIPSYALTIDTETQMIETKFQGYSQRMRVGVNSNIDTRTLVFEERTDRETVAICNYVEDKGGVDPVRVVIGGSLLNGKPTMLYSLTNPKVTPKAKNVNSVTVTAKQVFDPPIV